MAVSLPRDVLVVEDEPMIRIMAADTLADVGIMTWEAGSAEEALHVLEEHPSIGLVFTDVNLAGSMDGLTLTREVNSRRPDVAIVVTSGAMRLADEDIVDAGTFLPKPYQPHALVSVIVDKLDTEG
jgi:CheY-like chemotaxis protein